MLNNQNNQNHESESGVENQVFFKTHHRGTPKNCSIFGKPLTLCMILIILLIYFLIYLPYIYSELAQLADGVILENLFSLVEPVHGSEASRCTVGAMP